MKNESISITSDHRPITGAQVVLIGTTHIQESDIKVREIVKNSFTRRDIYLVEGVEKRRTPSWGQKRQLRREYGIPRFALVKGWDNLASVNALKLAYRLKMDMMYSPLMEQRDDAMEQTIAWFHKRFPKRRIIVISGKTHTDSVAPKLTELNKTIIDASVPVSPEEHDRYMSEVSQNIFGM